MPPLLLGVLLALGATSLSGQALWLPALISNHMVLQRGAPARLWGRAAPGQEVLILASWPGGNLSVQADQQGRWWAALPLPESTGPHTIQISSGSEHRRIKDVLVGEVWLCSGQSNMEMTVGPAPLSAGPVQNWEREVAAAKLPALRFFNVARKVSLTPAADCQGHWTVVSPQSVGRCSAVGFFFARELHQRFGIPVGILNASWGGTRAEAWTSPKGLAPLSAFSSELTRIQRARAAGVPSPEEQLRHWWQALGSRDPGSRGGFEQSQAKDQDWGTTALPAPWSRSNGLDHFDGVVWYRRRFRLPQELVGVELVLDLGPIDDLDTVWLDGIRVGGTQKFGHWRKRRHYLLPRRLTTPGPHVLALRLVDIGGRGGMGGPPAGLRLRARRDGARPALPLSGPWRWRKGLPLKKLPRFPWPPWPGPNTPAALYQGMIAPLAQYGIRGVLWYQGESNRLQAGLYRSLFPALIRDWRRTWRNPALPFYFVQIAPFAYRGDRGEAAKLREAQLLTAQRVPHTGMVVTLDIGNPRNIHPRNKQEVGRRLALLAARRSFGQANIVDSGPLFLKLRREGSRLRIFFTSANGGLATRDGNPPSHLEIAGTDGLFHPARARIDGATLLVWSPVISLPAAVHYAFGAADRPNLVNRSGLPASSFRGRVK